MTFVVVGGGPTGVELAGALGELAHRTLRDDFRHINPERVHILLLEGQERILPSYHRASAARVAEALRRLGVTVRTRRVLTDVQPQGVMLVASGMGEYVPAKTILWAAGVQPSPLGKALAERTGTQTDRVGRLVV